MILDFKLTRYNIFLFDCNVVIPVRPVLLVPKTNQMPQFMDYNSVMRAASTKGCGLSSTCSANIRITPLYKKKQTEQAKHSKTMDDQSF